MLSAEWHDIVRGLARKALLEDGAFSDVTSVAAVPEDVVGRGDVVVREDAVLCGLPFARAAFVEIDENLEFVARYEEGARVAAGTVVATVRGSARSVLAAERTALNYLSLLSGIATETRRFVERCEAVGVRVYDTRKTHPGLRVAEKYAVRVGGGHNHRASLTEAVFVKDNHVRAAGGLAAALERVREYRAGLPVIVEVESVDEARVALAYAPSLLLCDNMAPEDVARVVELASGAVEVEASGGVTLESVEAYAAAGVRRVSTSAITMRARAIDVSLEFTRMEP